MKVNYNANTGILSVGMSWSCDELSPKDPCVVLVIICNLVFIDILIGLFSPPLDAVRSANRSARTTATGLRGASSRPQAIYLFHSQISLGTCLKRFGKYKFTTRVGRFPSFMNETCCVMASATSEEFLWFGGGRRWTRFSIRVNFSESVWFVLMNSCCRHDRESTPCPWWSSRPPRWSSFWRQPQGQSPFMYQ
jgi:hypothetical protein